MHKVSDPAPAECPECKAQGTLEKRVSRTSFQLKGGGWYSDLYASTKKDSSSGTSTPAASAPSSTAPSAAPASSSSSTSSGSGSSGSGSSGGSGT